VLIGTACNSESDVPAVPDEVDVVTLVGSEWLLEAFGPVDEEVVADAPAITVTFGADSTFAGSAGCNRYFGRFYHDGLSRARDDTGTEIGFSYG